MAAWADYLISGVYFGHRNGSNYISHVQLHTHSDSGVGKGYKTSEAEVIRKLKAGVTIRTTVWNYSIGRFSNGAEVTYIKEGGYEYLRSKADGKVTDNLDNLLNYDWLL